MTEHFRPNRHRGNPVPSQGSTPLPRPPSAPLSQGRLRRACLIYLVALHLALFAALATSDLHRRVGRALGLGAEATSPELAQADVIHPWVDPHVPSGAVVFFGDSVVEGLAVSAVAPRAVNYGISGLTAAQLAERLPRYSSLASAGAIVVAIGLNDLASGNDDELAAHFAQIARVLPEDRPLVWSALTPANSAGRPNLDSAKLSKAGRWVQALCLERRGCVFVDAFGTAADPPNQLETTWLRADGLHLSDAGYRRWIAALRNGVREASGQSTLGE
jgi:lysophospholipase L1-like esterase